MRLQELLWVALGGAIGAASRHAMTLGLRWRWGWTAPWPTLAVNLLGCFAIGWFYALMQQRLPAGTWLRPLIGTGLLGGFTTYSAFAYETLVLSRAGQWQTALLSVASQLILGLLAAAAGIALAGRAAGGA